jgi:hypothetical protein
MVWCLTDQRNHLSLSWFMFPVHCIICEFGLSSLNHRTYKNHLQGYEFAKFPFEFLNNNDFVLLHVLKKNCSALYFLGGKGGRYVGLPTLPPSCADCLEILGASAYCSPNGLPRPVMGLLQLLPLPWRHYIITTYEHMVSNIRQVCTMDIKTSSSPWPG